MTRWSLDQVLALAPDAPSAKAARGLATPSPWTDTGAHADLVWGLCAGSGRTPYQTVVDRSGPAYRCSCPSRKFPCKHALALLMLWSAGAVPNAPEPAGHAAGWKAERESRTAGRTTEGGGERDEVAAAKRAEARAGRVATGMQELELWLRDQVRHGLSRTASGYGHAEPVAARMVDAQAPGVAGLLRAASAIPASGDGWPGRLLAAYGRLHLLALAHGQLDRLPADFAAAVRAHVGYTTSRADVLTRPPVADEWLVIGVREIPDATVPTRRIWLRGARSGRFALLLIFDPRGSFTDNPDAALVPGTTLDADIHFYPGRPAVRALVGARRAEPAPAPAPGPSGSFADLLADWADALEQDPWLTERPALVFGVPVADGARRQFVDPGGAAVPLLTPEPWTLLAVSGGHPVVVAGEWTARGLVPMTVWDGDDAVRVR